MCQQKQISEATINRLKKERKAWRMDHPYCFTAKPTQNSDGSTNILKWYCQIPGPKDTMWQKGTFPLILDFPTNYPAKQLLSLHRPPRCVFKPVPPHPNIYATGLVCLSILNEDWKPNMTVKNILLGIQKLLQDEPNLQSPASQYHLFLYTNKREEYVKMVKRFSRKQKKK